MPQPRAAFYCVSSARYFLGAVGMINSLRLHGHSEPVHLLDCGLTAAQRRSLESRVTVVPAPSDEPPFMLKTVAPLRHPAEVTVLIDADMVANRSLAPLIDRAAEGRVIAPELPMERHFDEWAGLVGAPEARRRPYVTSGLVALGGEPGRRVLELMDRHRHAVDTERTFLRSQDTSYPLHYADQDLLNAIISSAVEPERVEVLEGRLVATIPFEGLEVTGGDPARCAYRDGTEPYVVHHVLDVKPWLEPTTDGVYSRLLRRSLSGPGLAVQPPAREVPVRFRAGALGAAERGRRAAAERVRTHVLAPLAGTIAARRTREEARR